MRNIDIISKADVEEIVNKKVEAVKTEIYKDLNKLLSRLVNMQDTLRVYEKRTDNTKKLLNK